MARVTQDGEVFVTVGETEIQAGSVEKREEGGFIGKCALDSVSFVGKKSEVVANIESHFVRDHTTSG